MKEKYVYETENYNIRISQCKNCVNKISRLHCNKYDVIDLDILLNKIECTYKKNDENKGGHVDGQCENRS